MPPTYPRSFVSIAFLLFVVAPRLFADVVVSSPTNGATVSSPVHYVATGTSSTCGSGVAAMGIYVNNKFVYTVKGTSLNHSLTLATGAEHTVVEEWD